MYNFDDVINRKGTHCEKWDGLEDAFGSTDILPFWVADMDFRIAPEIHVALSNVLDHGVLGYPMMHIGAKRAVAHWQAHRHQWDVPADAVRFVPGVITGLIVAIHAFTKPGDAVIIQTPVYHPFHAIVPNNDRKLIENPLLHDESGYRMDFDHLKSIITPNVKAIIISNPHNPIGRVWRKEELSRLAEICAANNIVIFSDEIHQDVIYSGFKHTPLASVSKKAAEQTVTFVAPGKTFNIPGLRAAASIILNPELRSLYDKVAEQYHLSGINLMGIVALEAAYTQGEAWLNELLPYLEENRNLLMDFIATRLPKARMDTIEATYVCWIDFRGYGLTDKELQKVLVEKAGVALNSGLSFGKNGDGFARMNIGCPKALLLEGLERIAAAFAAYH